MNERVDPENIQEYPATNEPGDRWAVLKETSNSGKTMFQCLCCGNKGVTTLRICTVPAQANPSGSLTERVPSLECATWQRYPLHRYYLPNEKHEGWAIIVIGDDGFFSAVSDYGNYAFRWTAFGKSFKDFLIDAHKGWDYFASKLSSTEYSSRKTYQAIKEHILEYRKNGTIGREEAREEWDLLHDSNDVRDGNELDFSNWVQETKIEDAWEFYATDYPSDVKNFTQKTLKRLSDVLVKEKARHLRDQMVKAEALAESNRFAEKQSRFLKY